MYMPASGTQPEWQTSNLPGTSLQKEESWQCPGTLLRLLHQHMSVFIGEKSRQKEQLGFQSDLSRVCILSQAVHSLCVCSLSMLCYGLLLLPEGREWIRGLGTDDAVKKKVAPYDVR